MRIAEVLGKFEHEVLQLTPTEVSRWIAYFSIKAKEEKKAIQQARAKAPKNRRR